MNNTCGLLNEAKKKKRNLPELGHTYKHLHISIDFYQFTQTVFVYKK